MKRMVTVLIGVMIMTVSVNTQIASADLNDGLVAYWPADGDAIDATGNGHDGTLMNGAGFAPGIVGQAFNLDGKNDVDWRKSDYVSVVPHADFVPGSNDLTGGVWFKSGTVLGDLSGILFIGNRWDGGADAEFLGIGILQDGTVIANADDRVTQIRIDGPDVLVSRNTN